MVPACISCPADVTCSVSVTGNAVSESSCLYVFVTCVYPDMHCTHRLQQECGCLWGTWGKEGLSSNMWSCLGSKGLSLCTLKTPVLSGSVMLVWLFFLPISAC